MTAGPKHTCLLRPPGHPILANLRCPGQRFSAAAITDPNGFNGVDGIFRFLRDGTIQRGLAIIEANGSGFSVLRPAPRTFQAAGY